MDEPIQLGEQIQLIGFKDADSATMVVLRKIIGNYAKALAEKCGDFNRLKLGMKAVHKTPQSASYQINASLECKTGEMITAEVTERNLFFAIDNALKKLEAQALAKLQ